MLGKQNEQQLLEVGISTISLARDSCWQKKIIPINTCFQNVGFQRALQEIVSMASVMRRGACTELENSSAVDAEHGRDSVSHASLTDRWNVAAAEGSSPPQCYLREDLSGPKELPSTAA